MILLVAQGAALKGSPCAAQPSPVEGPVAQGAWPLTRSFQRLSNDRFHVLEPVFPRLPETTWDALLIYSGGAVEARNPITGAAIWGRPIPCRTEPLFLGQASRRFILATGQRVFAITRNQGSVAWSVGEETADRPMDDPENQATWTCHSMTADRLFSASDGGEVRAIDTSSGEVIWRRLTHLQISHIAADKQLVALGVNERRGSEVRFLDAATGHDISQGTPKNISPLESLRVISDGVLLCLYSRELWATGTGITATTFTPVKALNRFVPATLDCGDYGIIISPDGRCLCRYSEVGRLVWRTHEICEVTGEGLWSEVSGPEVFASSGETVSAFSLSDGRLTWRRKIPGLVRTLPPKLNDQIIFVVAGSKAEQNEKQRFRVIAISRKDGKPLPAGKEDSIITEPMTALDGFYVRDRSLILVSGFQMIGYSSER